jgi:bifunctional UDP-N-acetylglucosamine pyrophosphorylase / glucosamine-1-phosphate N-acetyltransferase
VTDAIAIVVLAAGMGTRMKSALPKVLHKAGGRSLLGHVLTAAQSLDPERAVIVAGPGMDGVAVEARRFITAARLAEQRQRQGTGHAVAMAIPALEGFSGTVLVLYGDVPLIQPESLRLLGGLIGADCPLAVLGFRPASPTGYGRLIESTPGRLREIVEEKDATPEQRKLDLCNSGIIAAGAAALRRLLPKIKNDNRAGEFYLTDLVALAVAEGATVRYAECSAEEVQGVNGRAQLAVIEASLQKRYREAAMAAGATLIAPETVFFSADTRLGQDVKVEPHVIFGPGVTVGDNVEILGFSHLEGATVGDGARIGPFARLRPGANIGKDAHIGNYVEIKKAEIDVGAKINHLSYIGDARVGAKSNIGAGTITCNYDGYEKHLTDIGSNVFVGSNTALVAPVKIGNGANIAAGSVITRDVPGDALAISRPDLQIRDGFALKYRELKAARKKSKQLREGT